LARQPVISLTEVPVANQVNLQSVNVLPF